MQEEQEYYTPNIPAEPPSKHPGRVEGIIAIICAIISLLFFPIIFGIVGTILGITSRTKGEETLGLIAIILSLAFMVIGLALGFAAGQPMRGILDTFFTILAL